MRPHSRPWQLLPAWLLVVLAPLPLRSAEDRIAPSLRPFVERGTLAGAVTLVASPDEVLSLEAVGYADVAAKVPMRTDALFWIASMSKPITATALMMLVDEGKVRLDEPVETYLPEFRGQMVAVEQDADHALLKKPAHPITVREVLSHTSGLPFLSRVQHKIDVFPLGESAVTYALTPLKSEPGTKYDYSNAGIDTAGRIVEVVSGVPFEEFLDTRLFRPLGMKDTTFWPTEDQVRRLARSYKPGRNHEGLEATDIGQLTYPLTDRRRGASPAGGLFSTATDVSRFCRMILRGGTFEGRRYVSESSVREMTSTQTGTLLSPNGENGYGLGWATSRKSPGATGPVPPGPCGHGGAHATDMSLDPDRKLITVFMVQHAGFPGDGGQAQGAFKKAAIDAFAK